MRDGEQSAGSRRGGKMRLPITIEIALAARKLSSDVADEYLRRAIARAIGERLEIEEERVNFLLCRRLRIPYATFSSKSNASPLR
jgi:hypothetical protein